MKNEDALRDRPMPEGFWGVICTLRQVPHYRFVGPELRLARQMTEQGLLVCTEERHYAVTPYGQRCYSADKVLASK